MYLYTSCYWWTTLPASQWGARYSLSSVVEKQHHLVLLTATITIVLRLVVFHFISEVYIILPVYKCVERHIFMQLSVAEFLILGKFLLVKHNRTQVCHQIPKLFSSPPSIASVGSEGSFEVVVQRGKQLVISAPSEVTRSHGLSHCVQLCMFEPLSRNTSEMRKPLQ